MALLLPRMRGRSFDQLVVVDDPPPGPLRRRTAYVVRDDVRRADSTTSAGSADSGQPYTAWQGTWGVSSNRVYSVTGANDDRLVLNSGLNNGTFEAVLTSADWAQTNTGLIFRGIDASNYLYVLLASNLAVLRKVVAGAITALTSGAQPLANGQSYRVRVVCADTSMQVLVDGVQRATHTLSGGDATQFVAAGATFLGFRQGTGAGGNGRFSALKAWR